MKASNALPLPLNEQDQATLPLATPSSSVASQKLWLCIYFPYFSLDVLAIRHDEKAHIVSYENKGRWLVHAACPIARENGVVENMSISAAQALCSDLEIHRRDDLQEQLQLKHLADWAYQFTPVVSTVSPDVLLLEIKPSLQLFGGMDKLLNKIQDTLNEQWSYQTRMAITPTPLASQLLAQYGTPSIIQDISHLRSTLADLPLESLLIDDVKLFKKLHNVGLRLLQDLWRLPRDALARRFGQDLLSHLDKLLGEQPDIRPLHQIPLSFDESVELPLEIADKKIILSSAEPLVKRLVGFLRQQDGGINRLLLRLYHYDHPSSHVLLGMRQSTRDYQHILDLLQQQLEKVVLPDKVIAVRVSVKDIIPIHVNENTLFASQLLPEAKTCTDPDWESLLEQLQNRIGLDAIRYLDVVDDHRPEYAWSYRMAFHASLQTKTLVRPSWLLKKPAPLSLRNGVPSFRGQLQCLWGPERIQTGWWEQQEVCRDYYIARDIDNRRLWIYRDLNQKARWYLHGFFA